MYEGKEAVNFFIWKRSLKFAGGKKCGNFFQVTVRERNEIYFSL